MTNQTLPVLPLRDIVVFPQMIVPLFVGREKSVAAAQAGSGWSYRLRHEALSFACYGLIWVAPIADAMAESAQSKVNLVADDARAVPEFKGLP